MRLVVITIVFSVFSVFSVNFTFGQGNTSPSIPEVWTSLISYTKITPAELGKACPHFPADGNESDFRSWFNSHPEEPNAFIEMLESRDMGVSRIQLGLGEQKQTFESLLSSSWGNAVRTYGSREAARKALPNIPDPSEYCAVEKYAQDINSYTFWRNDVGYDAEANEKLDLNLAPDPNDLFDEAKYPCLAKYYAAIDYWSYEYQAEYQKLMADCGCGGDNENAPMVMPDSIRPPYVSPMERMKLAEIEQSVTDAEDSSEKQSIMLTVNNPLRIAAEVNESINADFVEKLVESDGFQATFDYLAKSLTTNQASMLLESYSLWVFTKKRPLFSELRKKASNSSDYLLKLEQGNIGFVEVKEETFISTFKQLAE